MRTTNEVTANYSWTPNIRCLIENGKAVLAEEFRKHKTCDGKCHSCSEFRGVDLADTGKVSLRSCCYASESRYAA